MGTIKFFKVTSLPAVLEPDSMYLVNTAGILNIHISDNTGAISLQLSGSSGGGGLIPYPVRKESPKIIGDLNSSALTTLGLITNRLYIIPFITPRTLTLTNLRINVNVRSSGNKVNIGIYNNIKIGNGNDNPYQLVGSVTNISLSTTGDKDGLINFTFEPGTLYWIALISNGAPTLKAIDLNSITPSLGRLIGSNTAVTHLYKNMLISDLPVLSPTDLLSGIGNIPGVYLIE